MPEICHNAPLSIKKVNCYVFSVAFCRLGRRSHWPTAAKKEGAKYAIVAIDYFTKW